MSWCRWSTEIEQGKTSDLYIYHDVHGGVSVHIAGRRRVPLVAVSDIPCQAKFPDTRPADDTWTERYLEEYTRYQEFFSPANEGVTYKWETLPEGYAGKSHNFTDKDSMVAFLTEAKLTGLAYPDNVMSIAMDDETWEVMD